MRRRQGWLLITRRDLINSFQKSSLLLTAYLQKLRKASWFPMHLSRGISWKYAQPMRLQNLAQLSPSLLREAVATQMHSQQRSTLSNRSKQQASLVMREPSPTEIQMLQRARASHQGSQCFTYFSRQILVTG